MKTSSGLAGRESAAAPAARSDGRALSSLELRGARVLITTQVFPPEINPTAVMARELAEGLVRRGCEVVVAAGLPHHPTGRLAPGYGRTLRAVDDREGYRVVRCWHPTTPRRSFAARGAVMLAQAIATFAGAASSGRPDVVLSFGGPPLLGPLLSGVLSRTWRVPLVTVIHDIYPDVAVESGAVRSRVLLAGARLAERLQYRLSDRIVVLGQATRNLLVAAKKLDPALIDVLPVWLDPEEIRPGPRDNAWRREQGIGPGDFVVLYSGTAGIISGAEILADVARRVDDDVVLLLVGGGSAWSALDELKRAGRLPPNLRLLPYQPRERLQEVQASSDLSILTLLPGRGRTSVPSKLQGYMAAGRPVLVACEPDCDTATLVRDEGIGLVVPPGDPEAIARGIRDARASPERLGEWGRRGREAFERHHAREPLIDRYAELLGRVARMGAT